MPSFLPLVVFWATTVVVLLLPATTTTTQAAALFPTKAAFVAVDNRRHGPSKNIRSRHQIPMWMMVRGGGTHVEEQDVAEAAAAAGSSSSSSKIVQDNDDDEGEEEDGANTDVDMEVVDDDDEEWEHIETAETEEVEEDLVEDHEDDEEVELTEMPEEGETTVEERIIEDAAAAAASMQVETEEEEYLQEEGLAFQEEILVKNRVEEDDVRLVAGTTDGELADDEGMDSISTPEDAAEFVAMTGGGAVFAAELEEADEENGETVVEEEVVAAELEEDIEISDEMKQVLRNELKYTARDVKLMRPEIASMVVYNKLIRPIEGMPRNWYVEGAGPVGPLRENALKIAAALVVVGAGAALSLKGGVGDGIDMSAIVDSLKKVPSTLAGLPKSFMKQAKETAEEGRLAVQEALEPEPEKTFSEGEIKEMEDEVPHSIKPGSKPSLTGNEDKSALDKFLSKIENMIKGFFSIKI